MNRRKKCKFKVDNVVSLWLRFRLSPTSNCRCPLRRISSCPSTFPLHSNTIQRIFLNTRTSIRPQINNSCTLRSDLLHPQNTQVIAWSLILGSASSIILFHLTKYLYCNDHHSLFKIVGNV
ncbi:hypothetical protein BDR04DRAFT_674018 [Suillus decipiens]|nr:hypothetical protein BDR04DRAFT_674018 [Suillus decipiens]